MPGDTRGWLSAVGIATGVIREHRLRTALSCSGIAVAVGAMCLSCNLLQSLAAEAAAGLEMLGRNTFIVGPNPQAVGTNRSRPITFEDVTALRRSVGIESAEPLIAVQGMVGRLARHHLSTIYGASRPECVMLGVSVTDGRIISDVDVHERLSVCVLGQGVANALRVRGAGDSVTISGRPFKVVGIARSGGRLLGIDRDEAVFVPISLAERSYASRGDNLVLLVVGDRLSEPQDTAQRIKLVLRRRRHTGSETDDDFRLMSQEQVLTGLQQVASALQLAVLMIAAIALLVAMVGLLNSVSTSVIERFREIGIRRAFGATSR